MEKPGLSHLKSMINNITCNKSNKINSIWVWCRNRPLICYWTTVYQSSGSNWTKKGNYIKKTSSYFRYMSVDNCPESNMYKHTTSWISPLGYQKWKQNGCHCLPVKGWPWQCRWVNRQTEDFDEFSTNIKHFALIYAETFFGSILPKFYIYNHLTQELA